MQKAGASIPTKYYQRRAVFSVTKMVAAGLKPAVSGSVARCCTHWATGPREEFGELRALVRSYRSILQCGPIKALAAYVEYGADEAQR